MHNTNKIIVKISEDDESVGYIYMPLEKDIVKTIFKTIDISELIKNYNGIPVYLDFNKNNELVGIEISGNG